MKKAILTIAVLFICSTPSNFALAQTYDRAAILERIEYLVEQLENLKMMLGESRWDSGKRANTNTLTADFPSKYYSGYYQAIYEVRGTEIKPRNGTKKIKNEEKLWDLFLDIVGSGTVKGHIDELRFYYAPGWKYDAFIEQVGITDEWIVGINTANVSLRNIYAEDSAVRLFTHEYAHILYYYYPEVREAFENQFWALPSNVSRDFISEYAKINSEEDFAESFMYFVLNTRRSTNNEKVRFFYNQDAFHYIRKKIRDRLFD